MVKHLLAVAFNLTNLWVTRTSQVGLRLGCVGRIGNALFVYVGSKQVLFYYERTVS